MSTIIAVENFKIKGKHGVFDFEREKFQPFIVSIWVKLKSPAANDELDSSVDYGFLQRTAHDVIARGDSVHMMETLCQQIIEIISGHLNVGTIKVRIEKPDAPMPHDGGLALVEMFWPEGSTF
ncbi:MAG: dihydroneopterin aldolase [Candidatus Thalassarchaeaceae archaeon]|jgi:dihydroneopterin aldolase|nr:dihydroneopterin aldolase [Candidatus Thalassarchaeaceae archaeon]